MKTFKNSYNNFRLLSFVLLLVHSNQLIAQEKIIVDIEMVLEFGGANNLTIQEYTEQQELAMAEFAKAKEWWLPELYAGAETHQLSGAAMNADGRFFLDVNRQNLWNGLGVNASWDFSNGLYTAKSKDRLSQASTFVTKAERNQELLKMIDAYYDLLAAQFSYNAHEKLVKQSDSIVQQIQIQVENGMRFESEVLLAKSNKRHLQVEMLNARKAYNDASFVLKKLLNINQNIKLVSNGKPPLPLDFTVDFETDENFAYGRPELKAKDLQFEALQFERKKHTIGLLLPELNVGTYGSYFGHINGNVTPMFPEQYPETQQLYPTGALNASLMWKIPLGELTYQGNKRITESKLQLKKLETEKLKLQINEELNQAISNLQLGKEQIEISTEGLDFTVEALSQSIERQKLGTAKPFEVFQAQQFFLQAQLDYLEAVTAYNKAHFALKVAKGESL